MPTFRPFANGSRKKDHQQLWWLAAVQRRGVAGQKLFASRVELIALLDTMRLRTPESEHDEQQLSLRGELTRYLRKEVAAMNLENFLVRPKRRLVERFTNQDAWTELSAEDRMDLKRDVAGLPSPVATDNQEAKQFDLLLLRMQLALLRGEAEFEQMKGGIQEIARLLEEQTAIPIVASKLPLIQEIQSTLFWQDVTVSNLEDVRKGLRDLVQLIERRRRATVITNFKDELGEGILVGLPGAGVGVSAEKVREKALLFLKKHENDPAIHKLKWNEPLTPADITALESIFISEGSSPEEIEIARSESDSLGLFVRSLVGMNREAAKDAFAGFLRDRTLTANQIEFTNLVINHLAVRGWINEPQLYESPYTDLHPHGIDGLFDDPSTRMMMSILRSVRQNAAGVATNEQRPSL